MKRKTSILILMISILSLAIVYISIDRELFLFGLSNFKYNNQSLPLDLEPYYYGSDLGFPTQKFVIEDYYRTVVLGKDVECKYDTISFNTAEIIKYSYNKINLLALVQSKNGNYYFVKIFNKSILPNELRIGYSITRNSNEYDDSYSSWVEIKQDKERINSLVRIRVRIFLALIVMFPFWYIAVWIFKRKAEIDASEKEG